MTRHPRLSHHAANPSGRKMRSSRERQQALTLARRLSEPD
jgi:hypothetical protein